MGTEHQHDESLSINPTIKVLVLEDSPSWRSIFVRELERVANQQGYVLDITEKRDAPGAIEALDSTPFDFFISDWELEVIDEKGARLIPKGVPIDDRQFAGTVLQKAKKMGIPLRIITGAMPEAEGKLEKTLRKLGMKKETSVIRKTQFVEGGREGMSETIKPFLKTAHQRAIQRQSPDQDKVSI